MENVWDECIRKLGEILAKDALEQYGDEAISLEDCANIAEDCCHDDLADQLADAMFKYLLTR